jgi:hypothetical protein
MSHGLPSWIHTESSPVARFLDVHSPLSDRRSAPPRCYTDPAPNTALLLQKRLIPLPEQSAPRNLADQPTEAL